MASSTKKGWKDDVVCSRRTKRGGTSQRSVKQKAMSDIFVPILRSCMGHSKSTKEISRFSRWLLHCSAQVSDGRPLAIGKTCKNNLGAKKKGIHANSFTANFVIASLGTLQEC